MNTNHFREHVEPVNSNVKESIDDNMETEIELMKEAWIDTKEYAREALDDAKEAWHNTKENMRKVWLDAKKYTDKVIH